MARSRHGSSTTPAFSKKGEHSAGVARQYCGQLGKQDNCQVAVSLSIANETASLPIAWRLYLPEHWAQDPELRRKAKIPDSIGFRTKPQIALDQIRAAVAADTPAGVILADAGYGADGAFRSGLSELGLDYVVGVQPTLSGWRPGEEPLPPKPWSGTGRPPSLMRRSRDHKPLSAKALATALPTNAWHNIAWREGSNDDLASRFAAVRRRPASRDYSLTRPRAEEWLLIEWPEGDAEPLRYWLSTLPANMTLKELVAAAKLRWRIERDYRELKQELGLGHYEWPRLARLPPSCQPLHRRLRVPYLRTGDDPPLSTSSPQKWPETSHSPWFSTKRIHRSDPNGMSTARLPPSAAGSPSHSLATCCHVHAAANPHLSQHPLYDAAELVFGPVDWWCGLVVKR